MQHDPAKFHALHGTKKPRAQFYKKDFLDYALMMVVTALVAVASYGRTHILSYAAVALCAVTLAMFVMRHGVELRVPLFLRRPQDLLWMFVYKLRNLTPVYFVGLVLLVAETLAVRATPQFPHHAELLRTIGLYLFYVHLGVITAYRTAILIDHLVKRELVREVLMQTNWKRIITEKSNITREILHAYVTGLLTHLLLLAPWFLVIKFASFSVLLLPVVAAVNVFMQVKWIKAINAWFYRDHWLGHNSEIEFLFLHGAHHDAIPTGMIAVAENGFLEGFLRLTLGTPVAFFNPILAFLVITIEVQKDIDAHQYIPGVFPKLPRKIVEVSQHSTHHYGQVEPYSFGIKVDQPGQAERYKNIFRGLPDTLRNSAKLDEELTGFKWDNPTHRRTLALYARYNNWQMPAAETGAAAAPAPAPAEPQPEPALT